MPIPDPPRESILPEQHESVHGKRMSDVAGKPKTPSGTAIKIKLPPPPGSRRPDDRAGKRGPNAPAAPKYNGPKLGP